MLVEFGRAGWLEKARSQPDKVRQALLKLRTDGLAATVDAIRAKLAEPFPLGYCQSGEIIQVGADVPDFRPGDRVATNGPHATAVSVPCTLCARIPDQVPFEAAAFTPLAAVALHGVRLSCATLGETIVVYGLGLVGLMAVQLLRASGCNVVGIDLDPERLRLAEEFGARAVHGTSEPVRAVLKATGGTGADAVLLTLVSESDEPIALASEMCRKRGRLVLVGVTGLRLRRDLLYRKELSFTVSCSYGPGRYDPAYEENGNDYPVAYVRWTQQRNFVAVLDQMAQGRLSTARLISHRFSFANAPAAYELVANGSASLGIVLEYGPQSLALASRDDYRSVPKRGSATRKGGRAVAVVGAGAFAKRVLIPQLAACGATLRTVMSRGGTAAASAQQRFGFEQTATDIADVLADDGVDAVVIATQHDTHAALAVDVLAAGKAVFVEKPLALDRTQLTAVQGALEQSVGSLMVGFNRRFAPLALECQHLLHDRVGPLAVLITVNAGFIPPDSWVHDPRVGGGRIIGEACHFIDLARFLVGSPIEGITGLAATDDSRMPVPDLATFTLRFVDGSLATVNYWANGSRSFPKERIECFWDGRTVQIDNWRRLRGFGVRTPAWRPLRRQDKGHAEEIQRWLLSVERGEEAPICAEELLEVSAWSIKAAEVISGKHLVTDLR
jgi:predicted dehydrogenase